MNDPAPPVSDRRLRLAFFASHRGSNMQAVLDACQAGTLLAAPVAVISNNRESEALARARRDGLTAVLLNSLTHPDAEALDRAVRDALRTHRIDLVVLAGFLKKLGPLTVAAFRGRIINLHPALLPKYGGHGMYGLNVHRAVLATGEKETGVSIHVVDEQYDHGTVLAQATVPVHPEDTPESLAARVLAREHSFLVETLARICAGELRLPA